MEVTLINRQSYMAEVGNLLELITDEETRARLIAQMEQMFDAAEDEQTLIEQIGSPTKVAVALIRYADTRKAEEEAAPEEPAEEPAAEEITEEVPAEEAQVEEAPAEEEIAAEEPAAEEPAAESLPEADFVEDVMPETAFEEAIPQEAAEEVPAETSAEDALLAEIQQVVMQESGEAPAQEAVADDTIEAAFEAAFNEPAPAEEALPQTEAEAFEAEAEAEAANVPDLAEALRRADASDDETSFDPDAAPEEDLDEPETETIVRGGRVFLYLIIPGLVIGLPIFLALFAVSLVFLAVGVAAMACAVGVISSAFIGFTVVADMLLVLGAGASVFAVALVLLWFGIWFLIAVTFGWVRLMTRLGVRFTRKEVPVE